MIEILEGLKEKVNVDLYAKKEYSFQQMRQLRLGLISNIDISQYANNKLTEEEMKEIRLRLENEKNI